MSEMIGNIKEIERQLASERADIGKGVPMFARGRLNCNGAEEVITSMYPYADLAESGMVTLSPVVVGAFGSNNIGPTISLDPVFLGVTYHAGHRNWTWQNGGTDVSTRLKGWGTRAGNSVSLFRSKVSVITEEVGAKGSIRFTGTGFVLYYTRNTYCSKFQVLVDGVLITTVNSYNAAVLYAQTYTAVAGTFTNAEHLFEIVCAGDGAEIGTNFSTQIEQLEVLPAVGPTYANGNPVVTNISDTTQLNVGWSVTSALAGAARTILSIDSATQITMSGNATGNGDAVTTFAPPIDINYDLFLEGNNLRPYAWSNSGAGTSARAAAGALAWYGGYLSIVNYPSWRYVGSFRTHVAGYTRFTNASRLIWNMYNRTLFNLLATLSSGHVYNVGAFRAFGANTTIGQCRVDFIVGLPIERFNCGILNRITTVANGQSQDSLGLNTVAAASISAILNTSPTANFLHQFQNSDYLLPAIGYNYLNLVEFGYATSNVKTVDQLKSQFIG